jgi:hypothetical protein
VYTNTDTNTDTNTIQIRVTRYHRKLRSETEQQQIVPNSETGNPRSYNLKTRFFFFHFLVSTKPVASTVFLSERNQNFSTVLSLEERNQKPH